MRGKLVPNLYIDSVHQLEIEILKERKIKGIIVDIDNTLVAWDCKLPDQKVIELVGRLSEAGFKLCILSNNNKRRVEEFNAELKLPAVHKAVKPRKSAFRKAMKLMGTAPEDTAVIGDQIFTDILGGNRLGLFTILVVPVSGKEFAGTRLVRKLERLVLRKISKS